jgi:hypothetical protein
MSSTYTDYKRIAANMDRSLALTSAKPQVALETKYYLANIGKVRSIDDFVGNTRLFRFAMTAFGLEDMATAKGFVKKILTDGVADSKSLANRLADTRF